MGCCGSDDDYYHVTPYKPENERRQPKPNPQGHSQWHPQPKQYGGLTKEQFEKRERQARATHAAQKYGWPTPRGVGQNIFTDHLPAGNRDSVIEQGLAGAFVSMPGSEFRELRPVYDPVRVRQPQNASPGAPRQAPQRPQRPQRPQMSQLPSFPQYGAAYARPGPALGSGQRQPIYQQPTRQPPMSQGPQRRPNVTHRTPSSEKRPAIQPSPAKRPVVQTLDLSRVKSQKATFHMATPHRAHFPKVVRRDSNGVSDCSDDAGNLDDLRNYTVSPMRPDLSPQPFNGHFYSHVGGGYYGGGILNDRDLLRI
ncbi:hypothetical protein GGR57DRAFT_514801 [Xylariaceae sp. FL1272]|nr:hypothetical protein GGR57DRAFT_514801 [Xylariaceae sp. FL1272]